MQFDKHKQACREFKSIDRNRPNYLVVHYSCESFYDRTDGKTPRITSIAVRSFSSGQTDSFSIHKTAEKMHVDFLKIEEKYDELEKQMLTEFFDFVKEHKSNMWLHWNMRDINYGFQAIEHRFEVLGGKPEVLSESKKVDLARLFVQKYGVRYAPNPRLQSLIKLNHIEPLGFLNGAEEAAAFDTKDYIKLHQSTLRKVDVIANLLDRAIENSLKTNATWKDSYGLSLQGIFEYFKSCWWLQLIAWAFSLLLGFLLGRIQ